MKVLIIGSGGREHTLAMTYAKSNRVTKVIVAPGNGLMGYKQPKIQTASEIAATDIDAIIRLATKEKVDLVDVAPDDALAAGFVDRLEQEGIPAFGPTRQASQIEWDKSWSRSFMEKYHLPIPAYKTFSDPGKARHYVKQLPEQILFIKAAGLALGKGVIKATNREEAYAAIATMEQFTDAGRTFLIEEAMLGEEFSLFAICDGKHYVITKAAQDHKTVYNADTGPNTGGMGCVALTNAICTKQITEIKKTILDPFMAGMAKEGRPYSGILYLGGMVTDTNIKIVEFNARWGDPEAEVILPGITTDYVDIVEAVRNQTLDKLKIECDTKIRVSVAACSRGYPQDYSAVKNKEIFGIQEIMEEPNITVLGAGIKKEKQHFLVNGGRILHVVADGRSFLDARRQAYGAISQLYIAEDNLHYRTDIGWRELERAFA